MRQTNILLTALVVLTVLLAGCASDRLGSKMASWQGSHIDTVVTRWGPADSCADEAGQQVCIWNDGGLIVENSSSSFPFGAVTRPRCTRMLAVDDAGLVTGWRWRGDGCDVSGQNVMAKNEAARPSAVASEFEATENPATTTARK